MVDDWFAQDNGEETGNLRHILGAPLKVCDRNPVYWLVSSFLTILNDITIRLFQLGAALRDVHPISGRRSRTGVDRQVKSFDKQLAQQGTDGAEV